MKNIIPLFVFLFSCFTGKAQSPSDEVRDSLAILEATRVKVAAPYMSKRELAVIQQLNIARMYPLMYLKWYLPNPRTDNELSLYATMSSMTAITKSLDPDKNAYLSAECHAISSGKAGTVSHNRVPGAHCKENFRGECIQYGLDDPEDIILSLLVDEDVPSLGHRDICLSSSYHSIGVSMQPHKRYKVNAVLDFL